MNTLPRAVKRQIRIWLASGAILVLFLIATDPLKLPLPVLLIPFVVFAIWIRSGVMALLMAIRQQKQPSRKVKVIAGSVAAICLLILTLQSLGQLSWRDMLLVGGFIGGLVFYFYKTDLF